MANGNCSKCGNPLDSSHKSYCRSCSNEYARNWGKENPGRRAKAVAKYQANNPDGFYASKQKWRLKSEYGITVAEYKEMLLAQGGKCANSGCGTVLVERSKARDGVAIDHCHETLTVRGLLCNNCNLALGLLYDDVTRIMGLAKYLDSFTQAKEA